MSAVRPIVSERALVELDRALPSGSVITDPDVCAAHARDESEAEPTGIDAVVRVRSRDDAAAAMRVAHAHRVPVTPRAGGTGRTGGAVPRRGGWVLAFDRFAGIEEIDRDDAVAVVAPGTVLQDVHEAVEARGLFYPPDPNSLASCTLGGNIAENAGGPRAFRYGVTRDYVLGLEVVLADGTTLDLGRRTKKGVTGYDLASLVVGSEGTLALVTRATLHLIPAPEAVRTMLVFLPSEDAVADAVSACLRERLVPRCVELLDSITLAVLREERAVAIPEVARAALLVELDGEDARLDDELERLGNALTDAGALELLVAKHGGDRERLWSVRREMSRALRRRASNKLSEDVVVPRSQLGALLRRCREISARHRVTMPAYGHAGDGNVHVNFLWDTPDEKPAVDAAIGELFEAVVEMRGTLSGEHGIGVLKAPYLPLEQGPALIDLQRRIKAQFDPRGILNPGKIFPREGHGAC
ncbi:MAG TPA: FAD-linked oxidase C-terminal domain-containing protein [Sandaracinaceae bacterium LLY-WYZ-13_1]|nr:FAD-linked oxidase C-terminal domain-containing protein [Sandaracinaceae bacterium LLY-WYZ-13_1]